MRRRTQSVYRLERERFGRVVTEWLSEAQAKRKFRRTLPKEMPSAK